MVLVLILAALGACSSQPRLGVYRSATGAVSTSVSGGMGPLTVGLGSGGAVSIGATL